MLNVKEAFREDFTDQNGKYKDVISKNTIEKVYKLGLFKCFLPQTFNGLELDANHTFQVIRDAAYLNGSFGWLIQIGNGGNYFASCFELKTSKKWFLPKDSVIAGSGAPAGIASIVNGGFLVNGTWPHNSGSEYATLFTISFTDPESGFKKAAILRRKDVDILEDWKTIGLRQTSTHSISLKDVFIPQEQVFSVEEQHCLQELPILKIPFVLYAQLFFLQVAFGIVERILEESEKILFEKRNSWNSIYPGKIDRIEYKLSQLRKELEDSIVLGGFIADTWSESEEHETSLHQYHREKLIGISKKLRTMVHELYSELGIAVIYEEHPVSIFYRDLLVTTQHYLLVETH
ncbi:MAG: hypothetical protein EP305_07055 [Bacteroidetes bacterium]|nr:MAG: hypothetical protein EP305_07055 [Bacteroidota bacterium]